MIEQDGARRQHRFEPMSQQQAHAIAAWQYAPPYDFYDAVADAEDLAELLDPVQRAGRYFAVLSERDPDGLVGFFAFTREGDVVEVGLGLRPDLTDRGLGLAFLLAGLAFAREEFAPARFRLAVATFNQRAICVYERAGFRQGASYLHRTNGGEYVFLRMEQPA